MYCWFCGKEIQDNSVFCMYCGKSINEKTTLVAPTDPKPNYVSNIEQIKTNEPTFKSAPAVQTALETEVHSKNTDISESINNTDSTIGMSQPSTVSPIASVPDSIPYSNSVNYESFEQKDNKLLTLSKVLLVAWGVLSAYGLLFAILTQAAMPAVTLFFGIIGVLFALPVMLKIKNNRVASGYATLLFLTAVVLLAIMLLVGSGTNIALSLFPMAVCVFTFVFVYRNRKNDVKAMEEAKNAQYFFEGRPALRTKCSYRLVRKDVLKKLKISGGQPGCITIADDFLVLDYYHTDEMFVVPLPFVVVTHTKSIPIELRKITRGQIASFGRTEVIKRNALIMQLNDGYQLAVLDNDSILPRIEYWLNKK